MKVDGLSPKVAGAGCASIKLPPGVPSFSLEDIEAAVKRSRSAFKVRQHLQRAVDGSEVLSKGDVRDMLRRAHGKDGKPDVYSAAVVAYYAENHPRCFAKDAAPVVQEYLKAVDKAEWARLVADLEDFIQKLNEQRKEAEKADAIKKARDKDDLDRAQRKADLAKQNGTKAERQRELQKQVREKSDRKEHFRDISEQDHEEELTASGRVPLSGTELTKLQLHNKGFSKRD